MKSKLLRDLGLIAAIAAVALIILAAGALFRSEGQTVKVKINGELYAELPLSENAELDIDGLCLLVIDGGEAYVKEAVCRNQICVHHQPISKAGQSIVCLPNGVTVKITGSADSADFYI